MNSRSWVVGIGIVSLLAAPFASAESRPIKQLPKDLVRWSTVWMAIPEQVADVRTEDGPLAAMTWGPAKGAATMVERAARDLWDATKSEEHSNVHEDDEDDSGPEGPMFRYTF